MKRRYSSIIASPGTQRERDRIDRLARAADERWERARVQSGRMNEDMAAQACAGRGWVLRQEHYCDRSKSGRAVRIRTGCTIWTITSDLAIPELGLGRTLDGAVYGRTWEEALKLAHMKCKVRELNQRASGRLQ